MDATPGNTTQQLAQTILRLQNDRRRHAERIATIDRILAEVNRAVGGSLLDSSGATSASAAEVPEPTLQGIFVDRDRRRGKFMETGEQSILRFLRQEGNPDTAMINAHWRGEGRRGSANVLLLRLLKSGLIERVHDASVRGSRYRLREMSDAEPAIPTQTQPAAESRINQ